MSIDDYWLDIDIYFISFTVSVKNQKKKIERVIALESDIEEIDVETTLLKYFNNVVSIETIDLWQEGLLKNQNY
ncbi:hypothetical protein EG888_14765 [Listeria monocytogenes]|uniref:Uncharacterized protein n=1 Tax=Listeria monocytogenes TaxID=1639 RepID=A0A9Q4FN54_LISMN|nr:hypothetical protein [Listeria monocytogenes]EAD5036172.1 hypothetical protein [Listeria monocytogenes serotype 1/2a]AQP77349.1 hypothetical protein B0X25_10740 [Listeria monocytogenes]EAA0253313.1 hypothetical protein [Listeria monocytogenes]EAC2419053.1 hypothetical protein [Listeria monocytogenes]EAC3244947.1 hypothetical protein [Listeria monocytogenes]